MPRGSITKRGSNYAIRWRDPSGRQRWKTIGPNKREAEHSLSEIMRQLYRGEYQEPTRVTLTELADRWLQAVEHTVKPSTFGYYLNIARQTSQFFGDRLVRTIGVQDVEEYKADRLESGRSAQSVHHHLTVLSMIFKAAERWGLAGNNPVTHVRKPRVERPERRFLTREELGRLVASSPGYWRPALLTAALTGLRMGELFGLTWADVDTERELLWVRRALARGRRVEPKTKRSVRCVALPRELVVSLRERRSSCPKTDMDLVFPTPTGEPVHPSNFRNRVFAPALKTAGLEGLRFHDLRHSAAALMIAAGVNIKAIQRALGHASIETTMDIYGHLMPDADRETATKMNQFVSGLCAVGKTTEPEKDSHRSSA